MSKEKLAEYLTVADAPEELAQLAGRLGVREFARVRNLEHIYSPYELYPLAPHVRPPLSRIAAFAVDMDGTSTTTEPLALNALEYMVRRFTGLLSPADWPGLDPVKDYPHVIGNSNYRHTEFLVGRYRNRLDMAALRQGFFEALVWTLASMTDPQRRRDVAGTAVTCGLQEMLKDASFRKLVASPIEAADAARAVEPLLARWGAAFRCDHDGEIVRAALDIYYMRYHSIMRRIERGEGGSLSRELLGEAGRNLIEPMPGYDVFVPLVRGWLGDEVDALYEPLREALLAHPGPTHSRAEFDAWRPRLRSLAARFRAAPARLALVTASIAYETHVSMAEVFRVMGERVGAWPVPAGVRERVASGLADYRACFDGFVNASDACEHRLKPHRDLYSLALHQMSIPNTDYASCVGLEDTEPGIISLRAAGVGCAVALPNHDTSGQDYAAATEVVRGGLPELILARNLLLVEVPVPSPS